MAKIKQCKLDIIIGRQEDIVRMVREGADLKDIANGLGMSYSTLNRYLTRARNAAARKEQGEKLNGEDESLCALWESFARAQEVGPIQKVVSSLLLSCQDRTITKKTKIRRYDPEGKLIWVEEKEEDYPVAASVSAQQFYLANRGRKDWEYKPDKHSNDDNTGQGAIVLVPKEKLQERGQGE